MCIYEGSWRLGIHGLGFRAWVCHSRFGMSGIDVRASCSARKPEKQDKATLHTLTTPSPTSPIQTLQTLQGKVSTYSELLLLPTISLTPLHHPYKAMQI